MRITKVPGVMGGEACIRGTRISVWIIESYRRQGLVDTDFAEMWPHVRKSDIAAAIQYAITNPEEIEAAIKENK